jgi:hypothetical protein
MGIKIKEMQKTGMEGRIEKWEKKGIDEAREQKKTR